MLPRVWNSARGDAAFDCGLSGRYCNIKSSVELCNKFLTNENTRARCRFKILQICFRKSICRFFESSNKITFTERKEKFSRAVSTVQRAQIDNMKFVIWYCTNYVSLFARKRTRYMYKTHTTLLNRDTSGN